MLFLVYKVKNRWKVTMKKLYMLFISLCAFGAFQACEASETQSDIPAELSSLPLGPHERPSLDSTITRPAKVARTANNPFVPQPIQWNTTSTQENSPVLTAQSFDSMNHSINSLGLLLVDRLAARKNESDKTEQVVKPKPSILRNRVVAKKKIEQPQERSHSSAIHIMPTSFVNRSELYAQQVLNNVSEADFVVEQEKPFDKSLLENESFKLIVDEQVKILYKKQLHACVVRKVDFPFEPNNLTNWLTACKELPTNEQWLFAGDTPSASVLLKFSNIATTAQARETFLGLMSTFIENQNKLLDTQSCHIYDRYALNVLAEVWNLSEAAEKRNRKFIQRLDVPDGSQVCCIADRHGDNTSLIATLEEKRAQDWFKGNTFELVDGKYMLFLGDYVDRGYEGLTVILTILLLKLANPNTVFLVRGNHEDLELNDTSYADAGGFSCELVQKFSDEDEDEVCPKEVYSQLTKMYEYMPELILVGRNGKYMHACHGGIERTINTNDLLTAKAASPILFQWEQSDALGYFGHTDGNRWADFCVDEKQETSSLADHSKRCALSKADTLKYLQENPHICFIVRGHQHSLELMPKIVQSCGVHDMWHPVEGQTAGKRSICSDLHVSTLSVSPDSAFGINFMFDFDTCMVVTVRDDYRLWQREIENIKVIDNSRVQGGMSIELAQQKAAFSRIKHELSNHEILRPLLFAKAQEIFDREKACTDSKRRLLLEAFDDYEGASLLIGFHAAQDDQQEEQVDVGDLL